MGCLKVDLVIVQANLNLNVRNGFLKKKYQMTELLKTVLIEFMEHNKKV